MNAEPTVAPVEPAAIECVFCDGLSKVEVVGGTVRFFLFTWERAGTGVGFQAQSRVEIILPFEAVGPAIKMTLSAMCGHAINGAAPA